MLDVVIAGGGYVGLAVAVAIKQAAPHMQVEIVEAAPQDVWKKDMRASAIISAATRMLDVFGIWSEIEPEAEPIRKMIVTDSKTTDPVRPVFLTFDGEVEEGRPFAHMIPNVAIVGALRGLCDRLGITIRHDLTVSGFVTGAQSTSISLSDGNVLDARLLVACDGVRSSLRDMAGIKTVRWDYDQSGIVTTVEHERPHNGVAEEHFLPSGPFAVLPLKGNRSSLVWTERRADADKLVASDDFLFDEELERRFGHKLGSVRAVGPRRALAGDAAHGIHPISGQGLNLGYKDVAALAETIVEADRLGLDIGSLNVLERYQAWRRFDTLRMGITTDVLNRLFSNDSTPIRVVRDLGLGLVDRLPALKSYFIDQAAGLAGESSPKLLAGQPL